jgi:hypothetical protein
VTLPIITGQGRRAAGITSLVMYAVLPALAFDAYRIGNESFKAQVAGLELAPEPPPSHLRVAVPLVIAGVTAVAYCGVMLAGLASARRAVDVVLLAGHQRVNQQAHTCAYSAQPQRSVVGLVRGALLRKPRGQKAQGGAGDRADAALDLAALQVIRPDP